MLSQLTHIKSDPLDVLLFGVGLRLSQLAKSDNAKFKSLLENRNFTIQLGSEAEGINRYYTIQDGKFSQGSGRATDPNLTITFKDSMTGAKLLTKGDATAFMVGIQNGDLKMSGDYSLLMWFNQVAKFIVPKVPESLQPVVEHAKPLLEKAMPIAQGLFAKVQSFLGGDEPSKKSKYFDEENTKDLDNKSDSKLDTLKSKATELKEEVSEKLGDLKSDAKDKLAEVKETGSEKLDEAKSKLDTLKQDASAKLADTKEKAEEKLDTVKQTVDEKSTELKTKAEDKVEDSKEKLAEIKTDASQKIESVKQEADKVKDDVKELKDNEKVSLEELKAEAESKLNQAKTSVDNKLEAAKTDIKQKAEDIKTDVKDEADSLSLAAKKSQEFEAKHANDEVIADNVVTKAVKDDKSPITNISVTRNEDKSSTDSSKPAIVVQDKDGKSYTTK